MLGVLTTILPLAALQAEDESALLWQPRVDELVRPLLENQREVGLVVGISKADGGREFYCYGQTKTAGPAPTPNTLFEIGSVSKTMTALLLALMVEQGDVKLDDPAQTYLPEGLVMPRRGEDEITLRQLATHTSGLPRNPPNLQRVVNQDAAVAVNPFGNYNALQLAEGLAEIKLQAGARPGFAYSNLGYGLLGEALANKTGESFGDLVRTRICAPLKLEDTSVALNMHQRARLATGHSSQGKPLPGWTFASLDDCGAVHSTPQDILTYLEAYSGRTETELRKAMQSTQAKQLPAFGATDMGLAWFMQDMGGRMVWWHNGGTSGFKTCASFCEDPAVAVVVVSNTGSDAQDDGRAFYRLGETLIRQLVTN